MQFGRSIEHNNRRKQLRNSDLQKKTSRFCAEEQFTLGALDNFEN
tara:strand:- start:89281 stop:89415 length:135 start_codon:yes stop_codon:yes gene_type:complete